MSGLYPGSCSKNRWWFILLHTARQLRRVQTRLLGISRIRNYNAPYHVMCRKASWDIDTDQSHACIQVHVLKIDDDSCFCTRPAPFAHESKRVWTCLHSWWEFRDFGGYNLSITELVASTLPLSLYFINNLLAVSCDLCRRLKRFWWF